MKSMMRPEGVVNDDPEDGNQEADIAEVDEAESIDNAEDAPSELQDSPKQAKLLGLAADNKAATAAAAELLLHKSEPVQMREDVGDDDLLGEVLDHNPHAGGAVADDKDQEHE